MTENGKDEPSLKANKGESLSENVNGQGESVRGRKEIKKLSYPTYF